MATTKQIGLKEKFKVLACIYFSLLFYFYKMHYLMSSLKAKHFHNLVGLFVCWSIWKYPVGKSLKYLAYPWRGQNFFLLKIEIKKGGFRWSSDMFETEHKKILNLIDRKEKVTRIKHSKIWYSSQVEYICSINSLTARRTTRVNYIWSGESFDVPTEKKYTDIKVLK